MSLSIYIPAYSEPVSVAEMKNHLRVELSVTDDDALIANLTTAARDVIETATGTNSERMRVMLATAFDYTLHCFPYSGGSSWSAYLYAGELQIVVPRVPLISVTSITYVDEDGDTQTLSSSLYSITDADRGVIGLDYGENWPTNRYQPNGVTVRFIAGMAATFTAVNATDVFTTYGRVFTNGDRVQVLNSGGSLPAGLLARTTYYIISVSGATFQLSLTSGGSAVAITTDGSGTQFVALDMIGFETLRAATKLLTGHWYENREAVNIGNLVNTLPFAVDSLVMSQHV